MMTYPCCYCGSCPIWLAAFEPGSGLETMEDVIETCEAEGCFLVGHKVPEDE